MAEAAHEVRPTGPARKPGLLANILAIVGFIILIIIVIWGVLHIISLSSPWLGDVFKNNKKAEITVIAPEIVAANAPFNLSWKYKTSNRGTFAVLYQCVQGLKVSIDGNAIPCGAAYTLGNATGSASMLPTLSGTTSVAMNISILYIPSAAGTTGPEATGTAPVQVVTGFTVKTPVVTPVVVTPTPAVVTPTPADAVTPTPVVVHPTPQPKPVTPADLSVRIIAVGVIDSYTGAFVARAPYAQNEISAVQFDIQNVGGSPSGSYTFQANIPTTQPYVFSSQVQPSLGAGAHVVNTLRFTPAVDGTFSVQVSASDARQSNNHASSWVTGGYAQQYQQYPQYQNSPYYPQY